MGPSTMPPKKRNVIPVRACARCSAADDVFHLTMVGHLWLCHECHRALAFPGTLEAEPEVEHEPDPDLARRAADTECLRKLDAVLRWGSVGFKVVAYGLIFALSLAFPIVEYVLLGVFAADALGWVITAWFDAKFHQGAVTTEAVFYTVMFLALWLTGSLELPTERVGRYVASASIAGVLTLRALRFWHKLQV